MKVICTVCPKGCNINVSESLEVSGNLCKRGEVYAKNEATTPKRVITTTVGFYKNERLPVKTDKPIDKSKMLEAMDILKNTNIEKHVKISDVIIENILGTDVNIVASRTM